jgi:hypothetical protein
MELLILYSIKNVWEFLNSVHVQCNKSLPPIPYSHFRYRVLGRHRVTSNIRKIDTKSTIALNKNMKWKCKSTKLSNDNQIKYITFSWDFPFQYKKWLVVIYDTLIIFFSMYSNKTKLFLKAHFTYRPLPYIDPKSKQRFKGYFEKCGSFNLQ